MYNFLNNLKKERIYKDLKDYLEMLSLVHNGLGLFAHLAIHET